MPERMLFVEQYYVLFRGDAGHEKAQLIKRRAPDGVRSAVSIRSPWRLETEPLPRSAPRRSWLRRRRAQRCERLPDLSVESMCDGLHVWRQHGKERCCRP